MNFGVHSRAAMNRTDHFIEYERMFSYLAKILGHTEEAVEELRPNTTETVDAFIVVASHIAHSFVPNNLLAAIRLREWAGRNRGPVMVSC